MKTRILIIALALVFVSTLSMAGPPDWVKAKNQPGDVPAPDVVWAQLCEEFYTVYWETDCDYSGTKFSVVFFAEPLCYFEEAEECDLSYAYIEFEVDFGTSDDGLEYEAFGCEEDVSTYMLTIDQETVDTALADALADALAAYEGCELDECDEYDVYVKVKGLNPGKGKGRQNNEFSDAVTVEECENGGDLE